MEIRHLEAFVETVNCNSFSKAAKNMQLTQPTISSHINSLEKEVGTKLLIRTTKNMELTAKGRQFYEQVSEFLKMRDYIEQEFLETKKNTITIDTSLAPAQWVLPQIIKTFRNCNVQVKYNIRQTSDETIIHNIQYGLADIGLTENRYDNNDCTFVPLCDNMPIIVMPATDYYRRLIQQCSGFRDIIEEPMIIQEKEIGKKTDLCIILEKLGIEKSALNVVANLRDCSSLLQYVEAGLGIAVTSECVAAQMIEEGRLLKMDIPDLIADKKIYIVYQKNNASDIVDQFLHISAEQKYRVADQALGYAD